MAQRRVKRRLVVTTVVRDPAPDDGVEHSCKVVDPSVDATTKLPIANFLSDRLCCRVAHARAEVDEVLAPPVLRSPGPKGVAQVVEFIVGIGSTPVIIFAINDLRLTRMKLQAACSKTPFKRGL